MLSSQPSARRNAFRNGGREPNGTCFEPMAIATDVAWLRFSRQNPTLARSAQVNQR